MTRPKFSRRHRSRIQLAFGGARTSLDLSRTDTLCFTVTRVFFFYFIFINNACLYYQFWRIKFFYSRRNDKPPSNCHRLGGGISSRRPRGDTCLSGDKSSVYSYNVRRPSLRSAMLFSHSTKRLNGGRSSSNS